MPRKASLVLLSPHIAPLITSRPLSAAWNQSLLPLSIDSMAVSQSYVLLQKGEDPFHTRFEDLDGLTAFTMYANYLPYIHTGELTFLLARRCIAIPYI